MSALQRCARCARSAVSSYSTVLCLEREQKRGLESKLGGGSARPAMVPGQKPLEISQLRVVLREASPPIGRPFLGRRASSRVDSHRTIPLALGWSGRRAFAVDQAGGERARRAIGGGRMVGCL